MFAYARIQTSARIHPTEGNLWPGKLVVNLISYILAQKFRLKDINLCFSCYVMIQSFQNVTRSGGFISVALDTVKARNMYYMFVRSRFVSFTRNK